MNERSFETLLYGINGKHSRKNSAGNRVDRKRGDGTFHKFEIVCAFRKRRNESMAV